MTIPASIRRAFQRRKGHDVRLGQHSPGGSLGPAQYALHLGVVAFADHDQRRTGLRGFAGHVVDPLDEGTGGVDDLAAPRLQRPIGVAADAVGADDHPCAVGNRIGPVGAAYAHFGQRGDDLGIVDDGPQGDGGRRLPGSLHGPAHTKAKTRMAGQYNARDGKPPPPFFDKIHMLYRNLSA